MNQKKYILLLVIAACHSLCGYGQPWFKDDPVRIILNKGTYAPGVSVLIAFKTGGLDSMVLPLSSLRFSDAVSDTNRRYYISKLRTAEPDTIDIGITGIPGIYELLVEKMNTSTLESVTPAARRLYGDSLSHWYNFFIYKDTSLHPMDYTAVEERRLPMLPQSWAILDSFATKIKTDSFNLKLDSTFNHKTDSVVVCEKILCPQFTIIISNATDTLYRLNSVTIIADSSAVTDTAKKSFYINQFAAILLDTTDKAIDTLTLAREDKKSLLAELKKQQDQSSIIKTKGFAQEFMKSFADTDIRYWSDKYYVAAIQRKLFRQIIFVVKTKK